MAGPIIIACPKCKKQIKATEEMRGKKLRCKACEHVFVFAAADPRTKPAAPGAIKPAGPDAKKPAASNLQARPPAPEEDEANPRPYGLTDLDLTPRCPYCTAELESADAVVCLECGYNILTREHLKTTETVETTGWDVFLWLLPGILNTMCFLTCGVCTVWRSVFYLIEPPLAESHFEASINGCCMLWSVIGSIWAMYYMAKYAIKRLILNPTPPEKVTREHTRGGG
jgi:DNA-directed RNA polymerase subunit RPC12/RpoP